MSEKPPGKKIEGVEDNARKFLVEAVDPSFLAANNATSFDLVIDWTEMGEDNESKVAYKKLEDGTIQIILISKITKDGSRIAGRKQITEEEYKTLLASSVRRLEKKRYEFKITQNGTLFSVKYDEFSGGKLHMISIDASSEAERNSFRPDEFTSKLTEVTNDARYSGYRITEML